MGIQTADGADGSMLFASHHAAQLEKYMSWKPNPGAVATDAMSQTWNQVKGYTFPPFSLIGRCLSKVKREQVPELALIAPIWPTQPWFPLLVSMSIRRPIQIPPTVHLLTNHRGEQHPLIEEGSLNLAAWLVSEDRSQQQVHVSQKMHQSLSLHLGQEYRRCILIMLEVMGAVVL